MYLILKMQIKLTTGAERDAGEVPQDPTRRADGEFLGSRVIDELSRPLEDSSCQIPNKEVDRGDSQEIIKSEIDGKDIQANQRQPYQSQPAGHIGEKKNGNLNNTMRKNTGV